MLTDYHHISSLLLGKASINKGWFAFLQALHVLAANISY